MRKRILMRLWGILFCLSSLLFSLVGCNTVTNTNMLVTEREAKVSEDDLWLPEAKGKNEVILYDYYKQRFISYDKEKKDIVSINETNNFFQYCFNTKCDIYTAGHSLDCHYDIVKLKDNKINVLYRLEDRDNQKLYPCGADPKRELYYFIMYLDGQEKERRIVQFKDGKLKEFKNTSGCLMPGILLDDKLYYTIWSEENKMYDIYTLDITDFNCKPVLFKKGVENFDLFYNASKLYVMSDKEIYNIVDKSEHYDRKDYNYMDEVNEVLIQIAPDSESGLVLTMTHLKTGKQEVIAKNPVSYKIENGKITVYCVGDIVQYTIK